MTLADRFRAIRDADDGADLAELLGVAPREISWDRDGVTVAGERLSIAEVREALAPDGGAGRTVKVEDL